MFACILANKRKKCEKHNMDTHTQFTIFGMEGVRYGQIMFFRPSSSFDNNKRNRFYSHSKIHFIFCTILCIHSIQTDCLHRLHCENVMNRHITIRSRNNAYMHCICRSFTRFLSLAHSISIKIPVAVIHSQHPRYRKSLT